MFFAVVIIIILILADSKPLFPADWYKYFIRGILTILTGLIVSSLFNSFSNKKGRSDDNKVPLENGKYNYCPRCDTKYPDDMTVCPDCQVDLAR